MILAQLSAGLILLVFSLYRLFVANNAMTLGVDLLRVALVLLGITSLCFRETIALTTSVFWYVFISILALSFTRNEVQVENE